jgi:hypothetical protein
MDSMEMERGEITDEVEINEAVGLGTRVSHCII